MSEITMKDFLEKARGKTEVELTQDELEDMVFIADVEAGLFDLNNPVIYGIKIKVKN